MPPHTPETHLVCDVPPPRRIGGPFIRMFTALYPEDVGGLVYVDPTAILTEEDLRAYNEARGFDEDEARVREENLRQRLADPQLFPRTRVTAELRLSNFAEFHSLPPVPDVPVSVLISGRFDAGLFPPLPDSSAIQFNCEPRECHARYLKVRTEIVSRLVKEVTNGTIRVTQNSGHFIQIDEPDMVVQAIREVVEGIPPQRGP